MTAAAVVRGARGAVPVHRRSAAVLLLVSALGVVAFCWPLLITPSAGVEHAADAPWLFAAVVPLLLAVVAAELADGGMDAKSVAMLAVLAAVGAALRPLGGGVTGFQPLFVVLVIGGFAFGAGFGFVLGAVTLLASALITGGVGPWLPFQMLAAAWVGMGAGLLPHPRRRRLLVLAGYGVVASLLFGLAMNLSFWPWALIGSGTAVSPVAYVPGAPVADNLQRFIAFHLTTSMGWDLTRAVGTALLVLLVGRRVLATLERAGRRAAFAAPRTFAAPLPTPPLSAADAAR